MAHCRSALIFLLSFIFLVNINCDNDFPDNLDEFYRPQIWSLVNYLNANPKRLFNYNYATLISAQNKDIDNTDLTIDVEVDCRNHQGNKCITSLLECKGSVKYNTEIANYVVLSASCNPKVTSNPPEITRYEEQTEVPVIETEVLRTKIQETNAELQPVSEQSFQKTTAPCVGCPLELNPNLESLNALTDTALNHIESERNNKHVLLRIIRAQRQVVAGIKYILLLEIAPTDCPKIIDQMAANSCRLLSENAQICEVTYYQRPWINRNKNIVSNNCTSSQEFNAEQMPYPANDQNNEIDTNYVPRRPFRYPERVETNDDTNYDSIADGNTDDMLRGIMDSSRMRDLVSQIISDKKIEQTTEAEISTEENTSLTDEQKSADDLMDDQTRVKRAAKNDKDDDSSSSSSSSSEEDNNVDKNNNDDDDDDDDDNNNNDDKDYEKTKRKNKKFKKHNKKYDDNKKNDNDNDDDSSSSSSSSSEEDDNNDKDKHKSKKTKRQTPKDRVKRQASSSESNETSEEKVKPAKIELTTVAIAENKVSSEESSEEHRGGVRKKRSLVQTPELIKISPEERNFVENLADFSTSTLDNFDADNHKRVVLQILGSKKNIEETLYYLTLRVGVSKCPEDNTQIIDLQKPNRKDNNCRQRLLENLTKICKVQVRVDSDKTNPKVEKSTCQNIKKDHENSNINRTNRSKRGDEKIAGGINTVSPDDPKIVEYSRNLLKELDANEGLSNTREFVQVISASRQVVAGMRYRLKIKFSHEGTNKICDFDVWDRPWLKENGKEVTTNCGGAEKKYRYKRSHGFGELLGKDDHDVNIGMFKSFMNKHGKQYSNKSEFKRRFKIFRENMKTIKNLNENEQGTAKYGPTFFADLTTEEFKNYLGLKPSLQNSNNIPMPQAKIPKVDIPPEFDWRKKGAVTEVKNQGMCGSCWAFSVTGNIEGQNAIKNGNLIELSEQELIDCDKLDAGCNGGLPDNAYRAIEEIGGLETEKAYPYEAENEKCHFNKNLSRVQISGAVNISSDETDMAKWLVKNGPISIGINANAMQFYMGGVSHPWKFLCNPKNIDHGVLIVGYGVHKYPMFKKSYPYWIVKNSWGASWGEQGYYRVYRGDGTCGVNQMASSAVL